MDGFLSESLTSSESEAPHSPSPSKKIKRKIRTTDELICNNFAIGEPSSRPGFDKKTTDWSFLPKINLEQDLNNSNSSKPKTNGTKTKHKRKRNVLRLSRSIFTKSAFRKKPTTNAIKNKKTSNRKVNRHTLFKTNQHTSKSEFVLKELYVKLTPLENKQLNEEQKNNVPLNLKKRRSKRESDISYLRDLDILFNESSSRDKKKKTCLSPEMGRSCYVRLEKMPLNQLVTLSKPQKTPSEDSPSLSNNPFSKIYKNFSLLNKSPSSKSKIIKEVSLKTNESNVNSLHSTSRLSYDIEVKVTLSPKRRGLSPIAYPAQNETYELEGSEDGFSINIDDINNSTTDVCKTIAQITLPLFSNEENLNTSEEISFSNLRKSPRKLLDCQPVVFEASDVESTENTEFHQLRNRRKAFRLPRRSISSIMSTNEMTETGVDTDFSDPNHDFSDVNNDLALEQPIPAMSEVHDKRSTLTLEESVNNIALLKSVCCDDDDQQTSKKKIRQSKQHRVKFGKEPEKSLQKSVLKKKGGDDSPVRLRRVTFSNMSVIIIDDSSPEKSSSTSTLVPTRFQDDEEEPDHSLEVIEISDTSLPFNKRGTVGSTPMNFNKNQNRHESTTSFSSSCNLGSSKRKKRTLEKDARANKIPKRTAMPNFASVHKKMFEKMLDIQEYSKRKQERAKLLLSGIKPLQSVTKPQHVKSGDMKQKRKLIFRDDLPQTRTPLQIKAKPLSSSTPKHIDKKKTKERMKTAYGFKGGEKSITKEEQKMAVANKVRPQAPKIEGKRVEIQGVRSNRRFELLMKMRSKAK